VVVAARGLLERLPRRARAELDAFITEVDVQEGGSGFTIMNLPLTRGAWERVRASLFTPAAWMGTSSADLDRLQLPAKPRATAADRAAYEATAAALARLVERGQREALAFGEIGVDVPEEGPAAAALATRWAVFARDWDRTVVGVAFPRPPSMKDDPTLMMAHQALTNARQELILIASDGSAFHVPAKSYRKMRLDTARLALAQARDGLRAR
jgi:hypothetical protein